MDSKCVQLLSETELNWCFFQELLGDKGKAHHWKSYDNIYDALLDPRDIKALDLGGSSQVFMAGGTGLGCKMPLTWHPINFQLFTHLVFSRADNR